MSRPRKAKPKPPKVEPLGELADWSAADIARMAEITPEDIACAKAFWRANAPKHAKGWLDAKPDKGEDPCHDIT